MKCSVLGCDRKMKARGLCGMHHERKRTRGDVGQAEPEYNRGSGRSLTTDGYVRLYLPGHPVAGSTGWALEHRVVAFDLGWLTNDHDAVHHKNHDRTDNRPENLEVLSPSDHGRLHAIERANG